MTKDTPNPDERWCALLDGARRLIDDHNTLDARAVLRDAMTYAEEMWGKDDVHLIKPLRLMAESHWREHGPLDPNNEKEVECLQRALAIARQTLSPDHLEVGRVAAELGDHLVVAGHIDEGCALMLECLDIARRSGSEDDFSRYLSGVAHARMEQARPAEALPFFERAALVYERRDPSSIIHAIARYHLGSCLSAVGRYQDAMDQLQLALRLMDAKRVHGRHADTMNGIMEAIDRVKSELPVGSF